MRETLLSTAAVLVLLGAVPAAASEPGSRQTRDFVQMAAHSDRFEILEAETALAESRNADIKAFAQMMIKDHQRTNQTLFEAVNHSGLKPPEPSIGGDQSMLLAALQSQRGEEFDKAYTKQQVLAHSAALAIEQIYANSGDDPNVKQAAASAIPVIRMHMQIAEQIAAKLGRS